MKIASESELVRHHADAQETAPAIGRQRATMGLAESTARVITVAGRRSTIRECAVLARIGRWAAPSSTASAGVLLRAFQRAAC